MNTNPTDITNSEYKKKKCIAEGGEWIDPPGKCVNIPASPPENLMNASTTYIEDKQNNELKQKCENQGGEWIDPPGECKFPTI
ncbi:hypothetical protein [Nostoc parmelioides]|uniref:Uncharacterized protein n=1 Tax=Nostoc parmelioides FACHB-3921 TaxID=2692909 RepID=A0ABR8BMQ0_9NOSO|nr:hypothetical protein [Nostoc parmelioides]MBD2255231.1 hypothetical protein [Nostoc parmelioides FACHB-3921]